MIGKPMDGGAKIRIKVGAMEVEYEGNPSFLKDGLESLLTKMAELSTQMPPEPITGSDTSNEHASSAPSNGVDFSTSTIAAHLDAKSGTELAVCAIAKLQIMDKKASVTRTDILEEMKKATAYYNKNMSSNLSTSLKTLTTNKRINHGASETYSLSANERKSIEAKIAEID
jgi:hypothetical protein